MHLQDVQLQAFTTGPLGDETFLRPINLQFLLLTCELGHDSRFAILRCFREMCHGQRGWIYITICMYIYIYMYVYIYIYVLAIDEGHQSTILFPKNVN